MPPKNMISVTRNSHMPSVAVSRCCSMSAKWWRRECAANDLSANVRLLALRIGTVAVIVCFPGHHRRFLKIVGRRQRGGLPFQAGGVPGIVAGGFAVTQRPEEVDHRQDVADSKNGGSRGR